jgi:hypothetical protein
VTTGLIPLLFGLSRILDENEHSGPINAAADDSVVSRSQYISFGSIVLLTGFMNL